MRYELLRKPCTIPARDLNHWSTGGAILFYHNRWIPKQAASETFVPPWWNPNDIMVLGELHLAWSYEDNLYLIERVAEDRRYMVRTMLKDLDGHPLKSDYVTVGYDMDFHAAMRKVERLRKEMPEHFVDIYPMTF